MGLLHNFHVVSGEFYVRLRRRLSKVPFFYRLYRAYPSLRRFDEGFIAFFGLVTLSFGPTASPDEHAAAQAHTVKELLDAKDWHRALAVATPSLNAREALPSAVAFGLLTACEALSAWQWFEKTYFPVLEEMAENAAQGGHAMKEQCCGLLEESALVAIKCARLEIALDLLTLAEGMKNTPRYAQFIALLQYIRRQEKGMKRHAETIRGKHEGEVNVIGSIVWGQAYLDAFMRFNVRSMLSPGNMPHLKQHGLLVHSIVTTETGMAYLKAHPVFPELARTAKVEFFCFPDSFLDLFKGENGPDKWSYMLYGILDHTHIFLARALTANLFLIPVDAIVADPSFASMRRYLEEGYDCCGGANLVAERERFLPALEAMYPGNGPMTIKTHTLASLALKYPHHYLTSQLVHDGNRDFGKHAREVFWPAKGGIIAHSIYTHPLATSARRLMSDFVMPYSWVDFLLAPRLFTRPSDFGKYKIIENAAEAYINNFAPAARLYETTGRPFNAEDFACTHTLSYPIHRHMLKTRQFVPCELPSLHCSNNVDNDIAQMLQALARYFGEDAIAGSECHICAGRDLSEVIDFGAMPLSHQLRRSAGEKEKRYVVKFHYCNHCGLLQIRDPIPADALYDAETYATSFQKPRHIDDLVISAVAHHAPGSVLEIGCNDGFLLKALSQYGFPLIAGIEPNRHAAATAAQNPQHHVYTDYLTPELAMKLRHKHDRFDFIFTRHVLEHVCDVKDFFESIGRLISDEGILVVELPHVEKGFDAGNPVILWEEHVNYFSENTLSALFAHYGWTILERRYYAFGGGSIALIARRTTPQAFDLGVSKALPLAYYERYAQAIAGLKKELCAVVEVARKQGYAVMLYGAAPRSCTLVHYTGLGPKIDAVVDDRKDIEGRLLPGTSLAVTSPERANLGGKPPLVLLGVGAENEHIVLEKLRRQLGYMPIGISLFPPRDTRRSIADAHNQIVRAIASEKRITDARTA